ncbi:hypothetical protein Q1W71_00495 [Flavobacterium pectinovorum]|uniref:hypothetical protein n=1 Tax=Flavobacterium pectinovorum TaxID=29533 RepID=UPI00265E80BB|nr:hypothetical protein [Flavobacterium pectinovorum]WKL48262.1 hypothetical protein Q1W71_00495 [Flavobacterium pectinovorum]
MKKLTIFFFLFTNIIIAQKQNFSNPDKKTNCKMMKNGTFLNKDLTYAQYHMVIKNGIQTEYIENGYIIKSKMEFLNECEYKLTVLENTIPKHFIKAGDFLTTKILQTQGKQIKIKSTMFGKAHELYFIKMK